MCYVKRGKAPFEYSHFQCFSCEGLRISDQGIITEQAAQNCYALRIAPNIILYFLDRVRTCTPDSHPLECVIPDDVLTQAGPPDDEHLLLETCRGTK